MGAPLGVTTSLKATKELHGHAQQRAEAWGLPFFDRRKNSMVQMFEHADAMLLFAANGVYISTIHGQLRPNLSTAAIRLRQVGAGEGDPLIRAAELQAGDDVVDCTYGLGRDAVVAAHAIGSSGALTALEASPALFHMADENKPLADLEGAVSLDAAPISLVHDDARSWLVDAPAHSVDVVFIDPMFDTPKNSDASFGILRSVANEMSLDREWVERARRVARRWVVVKSGESLPWFDDVGLVAVHSHGNARWYRVAGSQGVERPHR